MFNYDEIVTQANERQRCLQSIAEQRWLAQSLGPSQPHPLLTWIRQQLVQRGWQGPAPKSRLARADTLVTLSR